MRLFNYVFAAFLIGLSISGRVDTAANLVGVTLGVMELVTKRQGVSGP